MLCYLGLSHLLGSLNNEDSQKEIDRLAANA